MSDVTETDEQRELRELREKRMALAAKRDSAAEAAAMRKEIAAERQALLDDEAWDAALAEHGERKIGRLNTPDGAVIVKRPNSALFRAYQDRGSSKSEDLMKLVHPNVVYPDKARINQMLSETPGILIALAGVCCRLAGFRAEDVEKK